MEEPTEWALHFGTEERRVVIAGHSHVICVLQALGGHWRDGVSVAYNAVLPDGPPLADAYWEFVRQVTSDQLIAIVWNGNQHHASFLLEPDPPIAVYGGATGEVAESVSMLVPRTMLDALWAPSFDQLRRALATLLPDRRVVLVGTPPPKRQDVVVRNLSREPWFEAAAQELGIGADDVIVTDERVRLQMWRIVQEALEAIAFELDVPFISGPAEAVDDSGFLLERYSADDATHANAAYGDLVCDLLERVEAA